MTDERIRERGAPAVPASSKGRLMAGLPLCLWMLLTVGALWRLALAWEAMRAPLQGGLAVGQGAVVVHWRQLDTLVGWSALLIWLIGVGSGGTILATTLKQARMARLLGVMAGVGVVLSLLNVLWDQFGGGGALGWLGHAADTWMVVVGVVGVLRELASVSSELPGGQVHLLPLWRLLTAQWVLAWLAATVYLRFAMRKEELLGHEGARQLLFALPGLGLLPNVLMLAGIRLWRARGAGNPRMRAWLLAMIAVNVGGILLVFRSPWVGMAGGGLMLLGVVMYVVGFPRGAWAGTRGWYGAAWGCFAAAVGLLMLERLLQVSAAGVGMAFYGNAWRHLVVVGTVGLWLLHTVAVGEPGARRASGLAAGMLGLGVAVVMGVLLATAWRQGEAQVPVMRGLFWGVLPEVLSLMGMAVYAAGSYARGGFGRK